MRAVPGLCGLVTDALTAVRDSPARRTDVGRGERLFYLLFISKYLLSFSIIKTRSNQLICIKWPFHLGLIVQSQAFTDLGLIDSLSWEFSWEINILQPWIFIGRTDTEAEAPILWPPEAKGLIGNDPDAGKD